MDERIGDKAFAREIIDHAAAVASGTPDYLDVATRADASLGDKDLARALMEKAEEQVTTVGEMKNIVEAIKAHFTDDADWVALAEEKLPRREANQEKYAVFQAREKAATNAIKTLQLADAVMAELDDKFYAQKLLVDAQKRLDEEGWDFSKARKLVAGVSAHLGDADWAAKLLKDAGQRVQGFANLSVVAESAAQLLPDGETANTLVKDLLDGYQNGLSAPATYDLAKLASARGRLLGDKEAAAATFDQAAEQGGSHLTFAELARIAGELGLEDKVKGLMDRAASKCANAVQANQLAQRLIEMGVDKETVRGLYAGLKDKLSASADRLSWADGIVDLFGDRKWAAEELKSVVDSASGNEAAVAAERLRLRTASHAV